MIRLLALPSSLSWLKKSLGLRNTYPLLWKRLVACVAQVIVQSASHLDPNSTSIILWNQRLPYSAENSRLHKIDGLHTTGYDPMRFTVGFVH
ncbi:hypothetical protein IW262DRAFT_1417681 [Armillaria fumosa]|nr:hypothetical protein IW262DRAFT_1417681 [Armillaria fumosa]